jgi:hypothetical protein
VAVGGIPPHARKIFLSCSTARRWCSVRTWRPRGVGLKPRARAIAVNSLVALVNHVMVLELTVGSFADQPSALLPINRRLFCRSTVSLITCNREHDRAN